MIEVDFGGMERVGGAERPHVLSLAAPLFS